jgi:hypothetical protein
MFENDVVGEFNSCAVSQKKCVPQKQDEGLYPLPAAESMVTKFDTNIWNAGNGRWYITAGLNKIFDTFDCQVHTHIHIHIHIHTHTHIHIHTHTHTHTFTHIHTHTHRCTSSTHPPRASSTPS